MSDQKRWLLPDGVDEVLPPRARALEELRRKLLDLFERWGYELVMPPIVEYLDSLLSGIGEDLDLQTFKLIDQVSGRMMGVRADITPQVARIDAHRLVSEAPQRFCYVGPVVHTLPDKFAGSRNPLQIGAELYGHTGVESDAEVIALLLEVLRAAGVREVTIELGHMGLFHAICEQARFDDALESNVLDLLLKKDAAGLRELLTVSEGSEEVTRHLLQLTRLNGGPGVLEEARAVLDQAPASVTHALDDVENLVSSIRDRVQDVDMHLDFAELRGYRYHTGIMFAAYTPDMGQAIAWGGRYDNIGKSFGRLRSATGFSTDLKVLARLSPERSIRLPRIFAPAGSEADLLGAIAQYRSAGYTVVQGLPGQIGGAAELGCDQEMTNASGTWQLDDVDGWQQ
jgi:ATP phosphoribosyltransferase regulatory subunit